MCGIAGYIGKEPIATDNIRNTLSLMLNRGPDHQAFKTFNEQKYTVSLLHSRLGIIDLEERSNQPFSIDECTLVFNGEIYNHVELREYLQGKGVNFKTQSDTEVLLQSYLYYGKDCVQHFEGMWSFAIYDRRKGQLFLSRDRFGEKPLYLYRTPRGIFFASEVKYIRSLSDSLLDINYQHLYRYLVNGYKSLYKTGDTFFKNIDELPYASSMIVDSELSCKTIRYWQPKCSIKADMKIEEAIEGFKHHLLTSIKLRLRSDVPLAFCLSGGVDSSAIVSIAAKAFNYDVATFSIIDSDERYNEYDNIRATIDDLGCKHTIIEIPQDGFIDRLKALVNYHDAPVYTISYYIHSFLSESISKQGYRVVASGTAADELLTGYYDHFNLHLYEMRDRPDYSKYLADWQNNTGRFVRNPYLRNPELYFNDTSIRAHIYLDNNVFAGYLNRDFNEEFSEQYYCDSLLRNRMMNELFHEAVPPILHEDDLNSMMFSIENRSPYLDSNMFDFCYSIPNEHLIQNGYGKFILRESVKGLLNDKVRLDRQKKGFNASIHSLIDLNNSDNQAFILDDGPVYDFVDKEKVRTLIQSNPQDNSYSKFIFNIINVNLFLRQFNC
ncbi:MAG TPA: asparagine synthase (glutamine-hydrolyzing) [Syntrophomonadaceae bacterium]|nr:asparagine synthase (glutamine-hydrolyzing) [Syntrophomonadaceae bacterium]